MTLTEVTVVFVLAAIVMTGLVAFYLNSQAVWLSGSTQVIAQREATMLLDAISSRARRATSANVSGDSTHVHLDLAMPGHSTNPDSVYSYWWENGLINEGYISGPIQLKRGPMLMSKVDCFAAHATNSTGLLYIDSLRLHTTDGAVISIGTAVAMHNYGAQ